MLLQGLYKPTAMFRTAPSLWDFCPSIARALLACKARTRGPRPHGTAGSPSQKGGGEAAVVSGRRAQRSDPLGRGRRRRFCECKIIAKMLRTCYKLVILLLQGRFLHISSRQQGSVKQKLKADVFSCAETAFVMEILRNFALANSQ